MWSWLELDALDAHAPLQQNLQLQLRQSRITLCWKRGEVEAAARLPSVVKRALQLCCISASYMVKYCST